MSTSYQTGTAVSKSYVQIVNMELGGHLYDERCSDALTHRDLVLWSLLLLLLLSPKISSDIKASGLDRLPYLGVREE